ncbi:hypothetical protein HQ571_01780 [Candidatus Kuenenbacteria bacterium]|nr:hypothetical protein [Candidatus Kuenenbacteria bacterium]
MNTRLLNLILCIIGALALLGCQAEENKKPAQVELIKHNPCGPVPNSELLTKVLGPGYSIERDHPVKYICYGGERLTEGFHKFFLLGENIIGAYGDKEHVVGTRDGQFNPKCCGWETFEGKRTLSESTVLEVLGPDYSYRHDEGENLVYLQFRNVDIVDRGYDSYTLRYNDGPVIRILGQIGNNRYGHAYTPTEIEVAANRPR